MPIEPVAARPPLGGLWAGRVEVVGDIVHTALGDAFETLREWDDLSKA